MDLELFDFCPLAFHPLEEGLEMDVPARLPQPAGHVVLLLKGPHLTHNGSPFEFDKVSPGLPIFLLLLTLPVPRQRRAVLS